MSGRKRCVLISRNKYYLTQFLQMFGFQPKIMSKKNKQGKQEKNNTFLRHIAINRKMYGYDQHVEIIRQET